MREDAKKFMNEAQIVHLGTVDKSGQPYVRAMLKVKNDDFTVYMTTGKSSSKMKHVANEPRVCLYSVKAEDMTNMQSIQIFGTLEVVDDEKVKQELWQDEWNIYYKGGVEDPEYTIIRLVPKHVMYSAGMEYESFDV